MSQARHGAAEALIAAGTPVRAAVALAAALVVAAALVACPPPARAAGAPQLGASWVTDVTAASVSLHAEVDPEGAATTYRFEYITEAEYQKNLTASPPREVFVGAAQVPAREEASLGSESSVVFALQHVSALRPATTYHYRIVATNEAGPPTLGSPRAFTTQELSHAFVLPDERAWELVSPVEKNGGAIQGFEGNHGGDVLQAAEGGDEITYSSSSSFGEEAQGSPPASQYISHRVEDVGWSTENITSATVSGSYGNDPNGVPYQLFSPDLSVGLLLNGNHCRGEGSGCPIVNPPLPGTEAPPGYQDYYLRDNEDGRFTALLTEANSELALSPAQFNLAFVGTSPDLRHIVLSTCAKLTPEATEVSGSEGCEAEKTNLYEWAEGQLHLVNLLPGEAHGTPGSKLAAQGGAISADGSRVYFTDAGKLYLREAGATHQLDESLGGGGEFQTATPNGSLAFFTKAQHLYSYQTATHTVTDLTPSGGVVGVLGASEDGSYLYYATTTGIFLSHDAASTEVASGTVDPSDYPPTTGTARVSADGTRLAFLSAASLAGYDNTDANTGLPDSEVYLYDASTKELTCASCNPTGERPLGPSTIPGAVSNGKGEGAADSYKPRALSADGSRLFFDSQDALVPRDTDKAQDVYEWEAEGEGTCRHPAGCLSLISSGTSGEGSTFIDASADGSDVYFLTGQSLVPSDPGSIDIYDARVRGGLPEPKPGHICEGEECQPLEGAPEDATVDTLIPGIPNPPLQYPTVHHTKPRHKKGHHKAKRHHRKRGRR